MAGRLRTQPSLLEKWQKRFKSSIAQYKKAKDTLDNLPETVTDDDYYTARDRERMLRGVVRGGAQMLIILGNPAQADSNDAIADLEIDYGMPGTRSRPRPGASPVGQRFFEEYYGTD